MARNRLDLVKQMQSDIKKLNKVQVSGNIKARLKFKFTASLNLGGINSSIDKVNKLTLDIIRTEFSNALDNAMSSGIWGTDDPDIVDTGRLKSSLQVSVGGDTLVFSYTEPYAALIHYGGYIVPYGNDFASRVYIPARPWLESVAFDDGPIAGYDFANAYSRAFNEVFK